jgi:hypothetical protein
VPAPSPPWPWRPRARASSAGAPASFDPKSVPVAPWRAGAAPPFDRFVNRSFAFVRTALWALAALAAVPPGVYAQDAPPPDGAATARLHLGAVALDPRLAIEDIGIDTNVFNDSSGTRDVTATIGPQLDAWTRAGRLSVSSASSLGWRYFHTSTSQRSFDASESARGDVDLGYLTPHLSGAIEQTRQRPNLEIDARVRHRTHKAGAGVTLRTGAKLSFDLAQERRRLEFDDVAFRDVSLADALDRRETETSVTARYVLTPLTSLVVQAAAEQDRFLHDPLRDTDSQTVLPGLEFKPLALISGNAFVGFRRFVPRSAAAPAFRGVISNVDLQYQLRDLTRLAVTVARNPDYSYEIEDPYYVSTGFETTVTQALGAGWDVVARGGRTRLDYKAYLQAGPPAAAREDRVDVYGVGIGRHLGSETRVGVDVNHEARHSTRDGRSYQGMRIGGSMTYGF